MNVLQGLLLFYVYEVQCAAPRLRTYNVNSKLISVSGFSSGAFFSVQFHASFSHDIIGAGIVAGGPFRCAQNEHEIALNSCMKSPDQISVADLVNITYTTAQAYTLDDPSYMKNDKVYLFSGTEDTVVKQGVMKKLYEYYSHFSSNVATQFSIPSEHAMVTDDYGNACGTLRSPYINNCNYSTAYHILNHIYGDIKMAHFSSAKDKNLLMFDQTEFLGPVKASMDSIGYIYVPSNCQSKRRRCRLHMAFHGCKQGRVFVSDTFARHAGYNGLAEVNNIIILYPQVTVSHVVPYNPNGCWDWWGYSSSAYASKVGIQTIQVKGMMDRILHDWS